MNKKGITLSINMVVILILAIVTLGIALGFITGTMQRFIDRFKEFPILEIEPTLGDPISFIPSDIQRGRDNKMTIGFYNNEQDDVPNTVIPQITCEGISEVTVKASGLNIPVGSWERYSALVSVPKDTPSELYSCTLTISQTEKTFFMEVK
ncbi:hypothetical protein COV14_00385 [Candidatus Woesearchaeota archaeon CG10_big_fil_rev_8_21_14_0_10_33_12]|nr:MAG: hypothetical protein COV14_00385 [Candidatus Woesearchaeota archaeon CG10_big_fil_rev_8_21_14_0_10_33_12]